MKEDRLKAKHGGSGKTAWPTWNSRKFVQLSWNGQLNPWRTVCPGCQSLLQQCGTAGHWGRKVSQVSGVTSQNQTAPCRIGLSPVTTCQWHPPGRQLSAVFGTLLWLVSWGNSSTHCFPLSCLVSSGGDGKQAGAPQCLSYDPVRGNLKVVSFPFLLQMGSGWKYPLPLQAFSFPAGGRLEVGSLEEEKASSPTFAHLLWSSLLRLTYYGHFQKWPTTSNSHSSF